VQNKVVLYLTVFIMLAVLLLLGAGLGNSIAINNLNHPHLSVSCRDCHGFKNTVADDSSSAQRPRATAQCLECHSASMQIDSTLALFHKLGDDCADCHSFHQPERLTINGDTTTIALARSQSQLCADCHKSTDKPEVSPGHREAARLLHGELAESYSGNPSGFCLACHDVSSATLRVSSGFTSPLLHRSASHPYDVRLTPGFQRAGSSLKLQDQIDPSIRSIDGNITCISCHSLTSYNKRLLVTSVESGLCTGCHDMQRTVASPVFSVHE
jgi:predicted CXXCH cytochrome family protein